MMRRFRCYFWRASALLVLAAILMGLTIYHFPQQVLTVDSGPVKADVLVVLGGDAWQRPQRAAELFKQGEAPKILACGAGDSQSYENVLENDGVPTSAILLENRSHTTRENAEFSIPLLRSLGAHRVVIVTSWYHSRRALACFEHYAPDITFYSRPSYFGYAGRSEEGGQMAEKGESAPHPTLSPAEAERVRAERKAEWKRVRSYTDSEYFKLAGYWVCYGICPI